MGLRMVYAILFLKLSFSMVLGDFSAFPIPSNQELLNASAQPLVLNIVSPTI